MESEGEKQRHGGEGKRKKNQTLSEKTKETLSKIKRQCSRPRAGNEQTLCTIHDNTSPGYEWLLPGWVAEERHMLSGRVYRVTFFFFFFFFFSCIYSHVLFYVCMYVYSIGRKIVCNVTLLL